MSSSSVSLESIRAARGRLGSKIHHTPMLTCAGIQKQVGCELFLKAELFQKTGSFKARGALNKLLTLAPQERQAGVITVSAGNHAQAVAWAACETQTSCVVVMPGDAPKEKIAAVEAYGGEVVLHDNRATLFERLESERSDRGCTFVHPFDDPVVISGAGTCGLEVVEDCPRAEAVAVPVGGGGLMSGLAVAVKAISPGTRVVAVELEAGPGLQPALDAGKPVTVPRPYGTLADGMTPPFVGAIPLAVAQEAVDDVVAVTEDEIVRAAATLMQRAKIVVEGSGAAATAAILAGKVSGSGPVVSIVSGGNLDSSRISELIGQS